MDFVEWLNCLIVERRFGKPIRESLFNINGLKFYTRGKKFHTGGWKFQSGGGEFHKCGCEFQVL